MPHRNVEANAAEHTLDFAIKPASFRIVLMTLDMPARSYTTVPATSKTKGSTMSANSAVPPSLPIGKSHAQLFDHNPEPRVQSADLHLPKAINLEVTPTIPVRGRLVKRQRPSDSAALKEIDYYLELEAQKLSSSLLQQSRKSSAKPSVYFKWAKASEAALQHSISGHSNQNTDEQTLHKAETRVSNETWDESTGMFNGTLRAM